MTNQNDSLEQNRTTEQRTNPVFANIVTQSIEKIRTTKVFPKKNAKPSGNITESDVKKYKTILNNILHQSSLINNDTDNVSYSNNMDISDIINPITKAYQKWISNKDILESNDAPSYGVGNSDRSGNSQEIMSKYNAALDELIHESRVISVRCQCIDDGSAPNVEGNKCPPCGLSPPSRISKKKAYHLKSQFLEQKIGGVRCAFTRSQHSIGTNEYQAKWNCGTEIKLPLVDKGNNPSGKLGRCEGDCDSDKNCMKGLICKQRSSSSVPIPGCISGGSGDDATHDYCYKARDGRPDPIFNGKAKGAPVVINNGKITTKINGKTCGLGRDSKMDAKRWSGKHGGKFLGGYASDKGKAHSSLEAAKTACWVDNKCGGITQESMLKYTTRRGTVLGHSPSGENSWLVNRLVNKSNAKWDCNTGGDLIEISNDNIYTTEHNRKCKLSYNKKRNSGKQVGENEYNAIWKCEREGGLSIKNK